MRTKHLKSKLFTGALLIAANTSLAAADLPDINPYRSPKPASHQAEDTALTCAQLDREISRVTPYTYNYRPDFDQDPYVGASIIASATFSFIGYGYLGFRAVGDFGEDKRIQSANSRIDDLRRLKAEKYCYEDRG